MEDFAKTTKLIINLYARFPQTPKIGSHEKKNDLTLYIVICIYIINDLSCQIGDGCIETSVCFTVFLSVHLSIVYCICKSADH